jgi:chromosome segregation ATPase
MAFPDHRGQALEREMEDVDESISTLREEKEVLHKDVFDLKERLAKLECQLEWLGSEVLTAEEEENQRNYVEAHCDI